MIPARINRPSNNRQECVCVCVSANTPEPTEVWHSGLQLRLITIINLLMISSVNQMIV